jgi:hypothetical protein
MVRTENASSQLVNWCVLGICCLATGVIYSHYLATGLDATELLISHIKYWSPGSSVGTATGYELDGLGLRVRIPVGSRILSSPPRPDRFWGTPSLISTVYRELFPRGEAA